METYASQFKSNFLWKIHFVIRIWCYSSAKGDRLWISQFFDTSISFNLWLFSLLPFSYLSNNVFLNQRQKSINFYHRIEKLVISRIQRDRCTCVTWIESVFFQYYCIYSNQKTHKRFAWRKIRMKQVTRLFLWENYTDKTYNINTMKIVPARGNTNAIIK